MTDPIKTALDAARTEASTLANAATGVAQGWLGRHVWGLLGVAAAALVLAGLALMLR
jgi:hypothetical protein